MIKLSFDKDYKTVYSFNNRVTIVTLKAELVGGATDLWCKWDLISHIPEDNFDPMTSTLTVSGKAKCHEDDVFDSILGERIAESKAKMKLYSIIAKAIDKTIAKYAILLTGRPYLRAGAGRGNCLLKARWKYEHLLQDEAEHLNKLIYESDNKNFK